MSEKLVQLFREYDKVVLVAAFFALLGVSVVTTKTLSLLKVLFDVYIRPGKSLKEFGAGEGAWAVITGASDGIGKEFAHQLSAAKFNVLLISRTKSKLDALAEELEKVHGVTTQVYAMDFTKGDPQDYANLKKIIEPLDVGILVNNVALSHEFPTPFIMESDELIHDIVETNIAGLMKISKLVIPTMASKNRGLVINMGSFSGYVPTAYLSVYSGTKAFLSTWSAALGTELKSKGILVEHVNTYFVVSAMSKIRKSTWLIPQPKPFVKSVLAKIGVSGGASDIPFSSSSYPSHALVNWIIGNTMSRHFWVKTTFDQQKDIRKRALRKRDREMAANKSQ